MIGIFLSEINVNLVGFVMVYLTIPSYDKEVWEVSLYIARGIFTGRYVDNTFGATHYHAYYVSPKWARKFRHTTTIDDHIFYRYD